MFGSQILSRINSLSTIWTLGSGRIRIDLVKYSFQLMAEHPLLGTGLNHFSYALNQRPLPPRN